MVILKYTDPMPSLVRDTTALYAVLEILTHSIKCYAFDYQTKHPFNTPKVHIIPRHHIIPKLNIQLSLYCPKVFKSWKI